MLASQIVGWADASPSGPASCSRRFRPVFFPSPLSVIRMNFLKTTLFVLLTTLSFGALAQEAAIRKNLAERLPNLPKIDEISKTPMSGLFEVRVNGTDIFYTDPQGNFLIQGTLIDTRSRTDLTEQRVNKLSTIAFGDLPLKDAFTVVRGNGKRQMAVFEDPNCGYCKRFERDLAKVDNVTVHFFLYPILGADSVEKSRNIWCAKDKGKAWTDWMLLDMPPAEAKCDSSALQRNVEFGRKARINGTPTIIFVDGTRVPGAIDTARLEKLLTDAKP
jgi:thiol:disulfide interchange protein DsbC